METTTLYQAIQSGEVQQIREMLQQHPTLMQETKGPDGESLLLLALRHGQAEIADLLRQSSQELSIHEAAASGQLEKVKELAEAQSGLINARSASGFTPLGLACLYNQEETARYLLEKGADIDAPQPDGFTPLHLAARQGNEPVIKLLLENMADINAMTPDGKTPMELAIQHGHDAGKWFTL